MTVGSPEHPPIMQQWGRGLNELASESPGTPKSLAGKQKTNRRVVVRQRHHVANRLKYRITCYVANHPQGRALGYGSTASTGVVSFAIVAARWPSDCLECPSKRLRGPPSEDSNPTRMRSGSMVRFCCRQRSQRCFFVVRARGKQRVSAAHGCLRAEARSHDRGDPLAIDSGQGQWPSQEAAYGSPLIGRIQLSPEYGTAYRMEVPKGRPHRDKRKSGGPLPPRIRTKEIGGVLENDAGNWGNDPAPWSMSSKYWLRGMPRQSKGGIVRNPNDEGAYWFLADHFGQCGLLHAL